MAPTFPDPVTPMMKQTEPWPTELRLNKQKDALEVSFDDGNIFELTAEFLRVHSPSAEVQGHGPDQRKTIGGKRGLTITDLEPVGNYAVKIRFADGHDTGLFSWGYLHELGESREARWQAYLKELEARGLDRG